MRFDPITPLLATGDPALAWAVGHDIFDEPLEPQALWELPEVTHALRTQLDDGSWAYHGGTAKSRRGEDYSQLATYQELLVLIRKYRLDRRHPVIPRAAEFLLAGQTRQGDIRGIYGSQYSPNYTADMLALLNAAGYQDDPRVERGIEWLLSMSQDDGGWALPLRTVPAQPGGFTRVMLLPRPIDLDRTRPSSHLVTGIALRALAAHPRYRHRREARRAAELLATRFFLADRYPDRTDAGYWTKLTFPFRWTDLVSSLDAIAQIGLGHENPGVAKGLDWLVAHQQTNGLWRTGYGKTRDVMVNHWVTFAVVRVFKRFFGSREIMSEIARANAAHAARTSTRRQRVVARD